MGSKGSQKTTQAYTPNAAVGQTGQQAMTMAQGAAQLPFQQQQAPVASFSDDQMSAFANMRQHQGMAQPYMNAAAGLFNQSAQPITGAQVGNYLNPMAGYVMSGLQDVFGQQRRDTTGRLTQAAGGVGADRIGVGQANLAKQQGLAAGQTMANLYQPALNAAQQDAQRQQSAGFGMGQLGPAAQNAAMMGTQGLYNFGGLQQQQEQAQLNSPYQWDLARIAHQYQIPQWLSGIGAQQAPAQGGTTTNTYPGQSPWGTIAGLGMTAAGAFTGNPALMKGGMSMAGSGAMGGASQGPFGMGGYQSGSMAPYAGSTWQSAPHGPGSMAPMFGARGGAVPYSGGGAVNLEDIGGSYQDGGVTGWWDQPDPSLVQGSGPFPPFNPASWQNQIQVPFTSFPRRVSPPGQEPEPEQDSFGDRFGAVTDNPRTPDPPFEGPIDPRTGTGYEQAVNDALDSGAPLPPDPRIAPQPPMPPAIPQQEPTEPIPPAAPPLFAQSAARGPAPPGAVMGQPAAPQRPPFEIPPDPNEGAWSRGPGAALMAAGLATLAAQKRDSRGLYTSPWQQIGEGGLKGVEVLKSQDASATQRRRAEVEARRMLAAAEHQRNALAETGRHHRATESHSAAQLAIARQNRLDSLDPTRLPPVQQALIAATRKKGSPLDDDEVMDIIQRSQRQPVERNQTPVQLAIAAAERRKGSPLDDNEILDIIQRSQRVTQAQERPGTPEQQAIARREQEKGSPLTSTEIAEVVRMVREGPQRSTVATEPAQSNILGDDTVAPNFEGATGGAGLYTSSANKVTGLFGSQAYPAESKATRILGDLAVKTQSTLQNISGRPSNYWLGRLESLTVKPNSWSEGPQAARDRLVQTQATVEQELKHVESLLQTARPTERTKLLRSQGELKNLLADYNAVIGAWGGGAGNALTPAGDALSGALPSTGQVRQGVQQNVRMPPPPPRPANAPPGSKLQENKNRPGQYRWIGPDGQPLQ